MAGVKGRSGGWRPGAGRKPKNQTQAVAAVSQPEQKADEVKSEPDLPPVDDPKDFLVAYMNDPSTPGHERRQAAQALMPYFHMKREDGKKKQKQDAAGEAASKFPTPASPPRLAAVA